ncbi:MAG TPA: hypothetical protein PLY87_29765, partial [Planctomycetaceae bacterium]|nr:hypothetical protein [Planctomycetaceae bacterium]
ALEAPASCLDVEAGASGHCVPGLEPWNERFPCSEAPASEHTALEAPASCLDVEAGASGQCVPGLEPWNEREAPGLASLSPAPATRSLETLQPEFENAILARTCGTDN